AAQSAGRHRDGPRRGLPRAGRRLGDQGRPGAGPSRDHGGDATAHELGPVARPIDLQSAGLPPAGIRSSASRLVTEWKEDLETIWRPTKTPGPLVGSRTSRRGLTRAGPAGPAPERE